MFRTRFIIGGCFCSEYCIFQGNLKSDNNSTKNMFTEAEKVKNQNLINANK